MDASLLLFPKKSHRKQILFPNDSADLAELLGIIYGDGSIGNKWQVVVSLNTVSDASYALYVSGLFERLFGVKPAIRNRPNQNTTVVVCTSTSLVDFLVEKGAIRGRKLNQINTVPEWISRNPLFFQYFIRGLIDTDGCIYLHKHFVKGKNYVNIGLCFTNYSIDLIQSIGTHLKDRGLKLSITDKGRRIYLYSRGDVEKYLNIFGSSNERILNRYTEWRSRIVVHSTRLESARAQAHVGSNPTSSAT